MKKLFILLALFFNNFFISSIFAQNYSQKINNFTSEITVKSDRSLDIKETIEFETSLSKHGIYRYIPNTEFLKGKLRFVDKRKIRIFSVEDEKGLNYEYEKTFSNNSIFLKIGDSNRTFTGKKTYVIFYNISDAVRLVEGKNDEVRLLWDITGEGWNFPILKSKSIIKTPEKIENINCYSGAFGTNDGLCKFNISDIGAKQTIFEYNEIVNTGDNFTIDLALPNNGSWQFLSESQKKMKFFFDNILYFGLFLFIVLVYGYFFFLTLSQKDEVFVNQSTYDLKGDHPKRKHWFFEKIHVPFYYEPFKNFTPAEIGVLVDNRFDSRDLVGEIIALASKKFLKIEEIKKKGIFRERDYRFINLNKNTQDLPDHQLYLFNQIFGGQSEIKLSKLKKNFYKYIPEFKKKIFKSLNEKKVYQQNYQHDISFSHGFAFSLFFMANIGTFILIFTVFSNLSFLSFLFIGQVLFFTIFLVLIKMFFLYFKKKTALGNAYTGLARGLKKTLEVGSWREKIHEKNLFIEEVLPFSVVFGVVKKLSKDMKELDIEPPQYLNEALLTSHGLNSFVSNFSTSTSSLSHSASGSSSSGGGGGGGGGGSW
jgi:uncharacterized membrane protein YgcG